MHNVQNDGTDISSKFVIISSYGIAFFCSLCSIQYENVFLNGLLKHCRWPVKVGISSKNVFIDNNYREHNKVGVFFGCHN